MSDENDSRSQELTIELPERFIVDLMQAFPAATDTEEAARMAMQFAVTPRTDADVTYHHDSEGDTDE